jgi:ribosomal protein S18 acetylase RimI-like enzyme
MQTEPQPLNCAGRAWARAELLAGDTEVFGFPVGRLLLGEAPPTAGERVAATESLSAWARQTGAAILWAAVPGGELAWSDALGALEFACIDLTLQMTLANLKKRPRPAFEARVRPATLEEHPVLESIAATAFNFGRYHRDRRFPRELANKRFEVWLHKSLQRPEPGMRFLVIGPAGRPAAFMFTEVKQDKAQLWLAAVAPEASNGLLGPMLYAGTLDALEAEGVRSIATKISAVNTGVMNIYTHLGFQASLPEFTYHWRSPASPCLLPAET